jgi:cardiolipin synthase A/B
VYAGSIILPDFYMNTKISKRVVFFQLFFCFAFNLLFFCAAPAQLLQEKQADYRSLKMDASLQLGVEPQVGAEPILAAINHAQKSIDLATYLFTDQQIAEALKHAAARGVVVRVLLERAPYQFNSANNWLKGYWRGSNVLWRFAPSEQSDLNFLHEKVLLIDHQQAWIMTFNFVYSSFARNKIERNFFILDTQPADVKKLITVFAKDWAQENVAADLDLTDTHLVISPINTSESLQQLLAQATLQIDMYAEELSDYAMIHALAKASGRGVSVRVLCQSPVRDGVRHYLTAHHVVLLHSRCLRNHAKAVIVDKKMFYLGSANFTYNAFAYNREVGLIVANERLAHQLAQQFEADAQCAGIQ